MPSAPRHQRVRRRTAQHSPAASTATPAPSQTPQASSRPLSQHSPSRSRVALSPPAQQAPRALARPLAQQPPSASRTPVAHTSARRRCSLSRERPCSSEGPCLVMARGRRHCECDGRSTCSSCHEEAQTRHEAANLTVHAQQTFAPKLHNGRPPQPGSICWHLQQVIASHLWPHRTPCQPSLPRTRTPHPRKHRGQCSFDAAPRPCRSRSGGKPGSWAALCRGRRWPAVLLALQHRW